MLSGRTLLTTSAALSVLAGSAFAADDGAELANQRSQSGSSEVAIELIGEIMVVAGDFQLVSENSYTRPSLSEEPRFSPRGHKPERRYGSLLHADSRRVKPVSGQCGNDDFGGDWDVPRLSTAPTIIEVPFTLQTSGKEPIFVALNRISADFQLFHADSSPVDNGSPEVIGEVFLGDSDRFSLGTFSASDDGVRVERANTIRASRIKKHTIRLRLSAKASLAYVGELDLGSLVHVVDSKGKSVGDVKIDWDNVSSQKKDDDETLSRFGDLTGDGLVNTGDFNALLVAWGTQDGDLNGDGTTDGLDIGIMLSLMESCWG